uniref:Uncharacterized protein n=1 Tax=Cyanothece sp. (strain PCC 7425 / ATCC 29141) TaxID=395961 RepID=B8HL17_CYAP4
MIFRVEVINQKPLSVLFSVKKLDQIEYLTYSESGDYELKILLERTPNENDIKSYDIDKNWHLMIIKNDALKVYGP